MKIKIFGMTIGAAVVLGLAGGIHQTASAQQDAPALDAQAADSDSAPADALPPDIAANAALVEVITMSQSGVSDEVVQNYINNVQTAFNLTASQLIYLKDIGIPDSTVLAMQQRDQQLGQAAPQPAPTAAPAPPTTIVSDDGFYDSLAPYGNWVVIEGYGRCWRPATVVYDSNWQPYCDHGRWVYTDDGWYWASDYSWGWAPFHYGRWFHDTRYGWCWWPDTVWAPSWVCWRYSDDYCGWAPLPPHCEYRQGVGLFFNGNHVSAGFSFGLSIGAFTFVATHDFCDPHPWQHRIPRAQVTQIYNRTTVINNFGGNNTTIINHGIPRDHIEAVTHTSIRQVTIRDSNTPIRRGQRFEQNGSTLVVNRPHIERAALHNENHNEPRTIPSPTTGAPMRVPPPDQNRHNVREINQTHNQAPAQNRHGSPIGAPAQSPANNGHGNRNQNNENNNRNVENRNSAPTAPPHPQNPQPAQPQTPHYTPSANQNVQPNHEQENSQQQNNSRREWRTMSPRMYQQQQTAPRVITPPTQRPESRNYATPNDSQSSQPAPHVERPQPEPRVYQQPPQRSQPQSAPRQSNPQQWRRDKNNH